MKKKIVEKHVTVDESVHNMLRILAKEQRRSMRAVISKLVEDEFQTRKK